MITALIVMDLILFVLYWKKEKSMDFRPIMLMIFDGFGLSDNTEYNAVKNANTPNIDYFFNNFSNSKLIASGEAVGLPEGQMGNSEVGHMNIGAGRIVYQDLTRISKAIKDGSFFKNKVLNEAFDKAINLNSSVHLMGLVSDGGVHSHIEHIFGLLKLGKLKNYDKIYIHCFMDGRDTPPDSGINYLSQLNDFIKENKVGSIASVMGRFYAMDRDKRWERIEKAYNVIVKGEGNVIPDPVNELKKRYNNGETDEFIKPFLVNRSGTIKDNDVVIFFNFRADRARELTLALTDDNFSYFNIANRPKLSHYVTMTLYDESFPYPIAFPPEKLKNILGEVIANKGYKQLRIAETEKYAHVTYFFNGGEEQPFPNEDRVLIPSPKEVKTYDLKPEMSAYLVTDEVLRRIDSDKYDFIVLNYANPDMVGHTGVYEAAVKAIETVDICSGKVAKKILDKGGAVILISDHGNSEQMRDKYGNPHTAHTSNPVPFIFISNLNKKIPVKDGILADVAPTILGLMGIKKPIEMTGKDLLMG
jgi:2,3-bisphosphoglycerate-independent phosphoglycerate mutase